MPTLCEQVPVHIIPNVGMPSRVVADHVQQDDVNTAYMADDVLFPYTKGYRYCAVKALLCFRCSSVIYIRHYQYSYQTTRCSHPCGLAKCEHSRYL